MKKQRSLYKDGVILDTSLLSDKAWSAKRPRGAEKVDHAEAFLKDSTAVPRSVDQRDVWLFLCTFKGVEREFGGNAPL